MKQLLNFYTSLLKAQKLSTEEIEKAVSFLVSENYEDPTMICDISFSLQDLVYLGERLPSLQKSCMHNFLVYLISKNRFDYIITFLSKIFVSHIDKFNYTTKSVLKMTNQERTFDRFIECCMWTDIPFSLWQDSFFSSLVSNDGALSVWKRPSRGFLLDWVKKEEKEFYNFVFKNFSKYGIIVFTVLIEENVSSAIPNLLEYWLNNEFVEKRQVKNILKQHYEEANAYITGLNKTQSISKENLIKVMLIYSFNKDVLSSLLEIYLKEKDENIKRLIIENAQIKIQPKIINVSQLKKSSAKYDENFNILGMDITNYPKLNLKNGDEVTNNFVNLFVSSYKALCSYKAINENSGFKDIFEEESINKFCLAIAKNLCNTKVEGNEWAYCLIAQNIQPNSISKIIFDFANKKDCAERYKLFTKLLIMTQKDAVLELFNVLQKDKKDEKLVLDILLQGIIESEAYDINVVENLRDRMVQDFDLVDGEIKTEEGTIKIMPDWSVSITNAQVSKSVEILKKKLEREIEKQTKRFENSFHSARMWKKQDWEKYILGNKLLKYIAKTLLWGKYCDKNLVSVFKIENDEIKNLASVNKIDGDYKIGIFHPVEYCELDWRYVFNSKNAPFNQLDIGVHLLANYNVHSSVVSRFNGFIVNSKTFFERMQKLDWKFGVMTVDKKVQSMFKTNKELGLLAEIDFSQIAPKEENMITLFELRFYRLNDILKTGNNYITNKTKSQELITLEPRYFSDIIHEITISGKK